MGGATVAAPLSSMPSSLFFLLLLFLLSALAMAAAAAAGEGDLTSDAMALLDFKRSLAQEGGESLSSWTSSTLVTVCESWVGVACKQQKQEAEGRRVSALRLPGKSLYGTIASGTLGKLDTLETLSLRSNKLTGSLPPDLAGLSSLRKLYLQRNNLTGALPADLSVWPGLQQLDLSMNSFSGGIPETVGNLSHLKSLYLQGNQLEGRVPAAVAAAPALQALNLSDNRLSGPIPPSLASSFPASCFAGNLLLCGAPLSPCSSSSSAPAPLSPAPISPSISAHRHGKKLGRWALAGIASGSAALFLALLLFCAYALQRKKKMSKGGEKTGNSKGIVQPHDMANADEDHHRHHRHRQQESSAAAGAGAAAANRREVSQEGSMLKDAEEEKSKLIFIDGKRMFDLEDLLRASAEVLGKGSLGTAYKAVLEDGLIVAVKRLRDVVDYTDNVNSNRGSRDDYLLHIHMIGSLRHENLLPLRAFYFDKEENLLVYDYMQNGSLSALLHGNKGAANPLDWESRVRIAVSAGRGLRYLHSRKIIHGSLKSSNVLLKSNLEAILSDYALVQMVAAHRSSMPPAASGYAAPEVVDPRRATDKADVYSFGVVLLELLTGKMPLGGGGTGAGAAASMAPFALPSSSAPSASYGGGGAPPPPHPPSQHDHTTDGLGVVDLPRWVQSVVREEWTAEVFDPDLLLLAERTSMSASSVASQQEDMLHLLQIAMPCVAPSPDQRPSMAQVLAMMENLRRSPTTDDDKSSGS